MPEPTPTLAEFLPRYEKDGNEWWRLESGHHQNLFEEAVEEIERLRDVMRKIHAILDDNYGPFEPQVFAALALTKQALDS